MIKKIINYIQKILFHLSGMTIIPQLFYLIFIFLTLNICIYRIILFPKLIILFAVLFLSEYLRVKFNLFFVNKTLNSNYRIDFTDLFDPIAILILLSQTIFNTKFINIMPTILIFWTKPLNFNYVALTSNKIKVFLLSFSKTLVSISLCLVAVSMSKYVEIGFIKDVSAYLLVINLGLIIINMLPFAPFEMGIMLEHLLPSNMRKFFISSRPYGSLIFLIFYYLGFIGNFIFLLYDFIKPFMERLL